MGLRRPSPGDNGQTTGFNWALTQEELTVYPLLYQKELRSMFILRDLIPQLQAEFSDTPLGRKRSVC